MWLDTPFPGWPENFRNFLAIHTGFAVEKFQVGGDADLLHA